MTATTLNEEQQQAVTHGDGPLLIIAGAGTGKTKVITERIKYLIVDKHVPPSEILALTFTEKASREMEERVDIALPYGYTQMWISTFHAFCDRILKDEAIHIGLNPAYKLATEAEAILLLRRNLFKLNLEYFRPLGNPYKFLGGLLTHFNRLKDDDITPEQYCVYAEKLHTNTDPQEIKKTQELANAYKIYEELKAKEGVMDFSDLIANVLKLFRTRRQILTAYQEKFKYILVDEFQDTNFAQNELAIMLARERKNINVVGDDDQAIYRWRGAALANITQFRTHFPESTIITLNKNYRSTDEILRKSHRLIQFNNPDRLEIQEKINKRLISMREIKGDPVTFLFGPRVENEADLVAQKINELTKASKNKSSTGQKLHYKDIAILVRANDHAQPFVRALEHANIPFQFLGPGHLFQQEEIKDLIAYLKIMTNFEDSPAMYRLLTHANWNFEARDIAAMLNFAKKKNLSLFEALEQIADTYLPQEIKLRVIKIVEMIKRHLKHVPNETAGKVLYYFLEESGLLLQLINPKTPRAEQKAQNIAKFFEKLKSYEAQHEDASVFAVTDWIDLSMQLGESPLAADVDWGENNAVNILTIHSSKGLEFPAVFVVNLVTQRFPTRSRREQIPIPDDLIRESIPEGDQNIAEERRLFYVAMTRARDHLYISAANYYGEGKRERKLSPFVYEVFGDDAVTKQLTKEKFTHSVEQLSLLESFKPTQNPTELALSTKPAAITYISYSQIQTFEMCPLHYKLRYILKLPSRPSNALSFGTSIHNTLRDYYQPLTQGANITNTSIEDLLKQHWINEGYTSKSHEETSYALGVRILKQYIEKNKKAVPIATEVPFQFHIGALKVGGRIDRIDKLDDGRIEIIDYKTGQNMPKEKDLLTNLQLTLYALAAYEVHDTILNKPPEEVLLSLHYLETDTMLSTIRTKDQLLEAKELLVKKAEEIGNSDYTCSVSNCKNCEYAMLCITGTN